MDAENEIIIQDQREDILTTVIFHNTEDISPLTDLICKFSVKCKELDYYGTQFWIAIFKVGWESTEDYLMKTRFIFDKTAIASGSGNDIENEVNKSHEDPLEIIFAAKELPESNDDEFYQFCFLTEKGYVLGASGPFQIKEEAVLLSRPSSLIDSELEGDEQVKHELEWCSWFEVSGEEVDGAVLVHNKTTMLEKSLANVAEENNHLRDYKDKLEMEIKDLGEQMMEIQQQKGTVERLLLEKRRQEKSDMNQLDELQEKIEQKIQVEKLLKGELSQLKKHVQMLQNELDSSHSEIGNLDALLKMERGQERDKLIREFEQKLHLSETALRDVKEELAHEKEFKKSLIVKRELEVDHVKTSMEKLITDLAEKQDCVYYLEENKIKLMHDLKSEQENSVLLKVEYVNIIAEKESKIGELQEANDLLCNSSDQKILDLQMEIKNRGNKNDELTKEHAKQIEIYNTERKILEEQLEKVKQVFDNQGTEHSHLKEEIKILKNENAGMKEKASGDNGSRHALQVAYFHTQKQMSQLKNANEQLQQHCQDLKQKLSPHEPKDKAGDLQKQVEDLKLRLCMGANAYKEKYLECKRLQSQMRKFKESTSSICDTSADSNSQVLTEDVETVRGAIKLPEDEHNKTKNFVTEDSHMSTDLVKVQKEMKLNVQKNEKLEELLDKSKKDHEKVVFALTSEIRNLEVEVSEKEHRMGKLKEAEEGFKQDKELREHAEGMVRERLEGLREENVHLKEENVELRTKLEEAKNIAASGLPQNHQCVISTQPQPFQPSIQGFPVKQDQEAQRFTSKQDKEPFKIFRPPQLYEQDIEVPLPRGMVSMARPVSPARQPQKTDVLNQNVYVQDGINQYQPQLIPHIRTRQERKKAGNAGKDQLAQRMIPVTSCPVCNMEFPPGSSELSATQHINQHFSN